MDTIQRLDIEEVYLSQKTHPKGLTPEEVGKRLSAVRKKTDIFKILFARAGSVSKQFTHFFALVLWTAAALCFLADYFQPGENMATLGWAIVMIIFINGAFSFAQEYRAEKATEALESLLPLKANALRAGEMTEVPVDLLVEGDVVILQEGDKVPADIRLVETHDLKVSNATLTGESDVLTRTAQPSAAGTLFEAENIVFSGTLVLAGRGHGVVFATGSKTQFGRVSLLTTGIKRTLSPLEKEIEKGSLKISLIAVSIGAFFFVLGSLIGRPIWENMLFAVGTIVALVPEGLMPTVTLTLAAGSQRMARRNALVKKLNAIETLGCTTVICTDKTGTITENNMRVEKVWLLDESAETRDKAYLVMGLANSILFSPAEEDWSGDPMEMALVRAAADYYKNKAGGFPDAGRLEEFGFTPERKRMTVLYSLSPGGMYLAATKGAVEIVPLLCRLAGGDLSRVEKAAAEMAGQAMRVMALAVKTGEKTSADAAAWEDDMNFLGLVGLADPIRRDVPEAVELCHDAGIRVMMITGDMPATAHAIARQAKIVPDEGEPVLLTGSAIEEMSTEKIKEALRSPHVVFARMKPEHKLTIVTALQEMGEVVAMTGDGVNDSPALRKSDIGIAMGLRGNDVARETADIVLLDDHFATIVSAVEEGRAVFSNIRKFITYVLTSNTAEIVPYLSFVLLRIPLPLPIIQVIAIDLGTDMLPALALGLEKPSHAAMKKPPRGRDERLMSRGLLLRAFVFLGLLEAMAGMAGYFYIMRGGGWQWGVQLGHFDPLYLQATTACLAGIVMAQMANLFACRSDTVSTFRLSLKSNLYLFMGLGYEVAILLLIVFTQPGNTIFRTLPITGDVWLFMLIAPPVLLLADETRKIFVRRRKKPSKPIKAF
jgi:sodium/potassium-transporting ATPase subunit alpha